MNYSSLGYDVVERTIANCDKMSKNGDSPVCQSIFGEIRLYKVSARGRFYSVSDSNVLHNGGSYKIGTLKRKLRELRELYPQYGKVR